MLILWMLLLFQIKHCIADFFLQSGQSVGAKHVYANRSNLMHAGNHGWLTGLVVFVVTQQWLLAVLFAVVDWIIHLHIDWAKARLVHQKNWTVTDTPFWWAFGVDQFLHQITYLGFVAIILG